MNVGNLSHTSSSRAKTSSDAHFRAGIGPLFLPVLIIAFGYGLLWLYLFIVGESNSALARICMFVLLLGVPLIIAYKLLRLATVGIKVYDDILRVHSGFPRRDSVEVPYDFIEKIEIFHGFFGRWTGSVTLHIHLSAGKSISVIGLKRPYDAKSKIEALCSKL